MGKRSSSNWRKLVLVSGVLVAGCGSYSFSNLEEVSSEDFPAKTVMQSEGEGLGGLFNLIHHYVFQGHGEGQEKGAPILAASSFDSLVLGAKKPVVLAFARGPNTRGGGDNFGKEFSELAEGMGKRFFYLSQLPGPLRI
jgi:hypothetical protein